MKDRALQVFKGLIWVLRFLWMVVFFWIMILASPVWIIVYILTGFNVFNYWFSILKI